MQSKKKKWDEKHPELIRKSKRKYEQKNPTWSFRPNDELRQWLEEERWRNEDNTPESNAQLLTRKLTKLMKLEQRGY